MASAPDDILGPSLLGVFDMSGVMSALGDAREDAWAEQMAGVARRNRLPMPSLTDEEKRDAARLKRMMLERLGFKHGSVHHLIENVFAECVEAGTSLNDMTLNGAFLSLLDTHVAGLRCTASHQILGLNDETARFTISLPTVGMEGVRFLVPQFDFRQTLTDMTYIDANSLYHLREAYRSRFHVACPMRERVLVASSRSSAMGGAFPSPSPHFPPGTPAMVALVAQHCQPAPPSPAVPEVSPEGFDITSVRHFNSIMRGVRVDLHWPRMKVLLLASSHDAEDGEHSGLERLSSELVSHIGHFLLHGRTDLSGYQVVGTYALPWEERPEHNEVMATYGHGICDEALPVPLASAAAAAPPAAAARAAVLRHGLAHTRLLDRCID